MRLCALNKSGDKNMKMWLRIKNIIINLILSLFMEVYYFIKYMCEAGMGYTSTKRYKAGKRIVILGNGPNQKMYWKFKDFFSEYDIVCVNFFPLENEQLFFDVQPRYICLIDPRFFKDDESDCELRRRICEMWKNLRKVSWDLTVITVSKNQAFVIEQGLKCICLSNLSFPNYKCDFIKKYYFRNKFITGGNTVINYALDFAIIFGYEEIALFGIEHDWLQNMHVDEKNNIVFRDRHDYGEVIRRLPGGITDNTGGMKKELYSEYNVFRAYYQAAELARLANVDVKNYCLESYVDCFEKIEL